MVLKVVSALQHFATVCLFISLATCSIPTKADEEAHPVWVDELIAEMLSVPARDPPSFIAKYTYQGQQVYYVPPFCCDAFGILYDSEGNIMCYPDGGISGGGDGRCPDFFDETVFDVMVWEDSRKRGES